MIDVWVDGSCVPQDPNKPGGWAAIFEHGAEYSGSALHTTSNRMELTAVINAIDYAPCFCELVIHTDSANIIGWMNGSYERKDQTIRTLCRVIESNARSAGITLRFEKVPAHSGIAMNERADRLAKAAVGR